MMGGMIKRLCVVAGLVALTLSAAISRAAECPVEWSSMGPVDLAVLSEQLANQGKAASEQRTLLADYISCRFLADEITTDMVDAHNWEKFVTFLGQDMKLSTREHWRTQLRSRFGSKEMGYEEAKRIQGALWGLGEKHGNAFIAAWTGNHTSWQSWTLEELVGLGGMLGWGFPVEPVVTQGRRRVASHIATTHMSDDPSVRSVGLEHWTRFVKYYTEGLSQSERATWANKLRSAFCVTDSDVGELSIDSVGPVAEAMSTLGAKEEAASLAFVWIETHINRELQPEDFQKALSLGRAMASLKNAPTAAAALAGWRNKLRTTYGTRAMGYQEARAIQDVLWELGEQHGNEFLATWTGHSDTWKTWTVDQLADLGRRLGYGYPAEQAVTSGRRRVAIHITGKYFLNDSVAGSVGTHRWSQFAKYYHDGLDEEERQLWGRRLLEVFPVGKDDDLQAMKPQDISNLARALGALGNDGAATKIVLDWLKAQGLQKFLVGAIDGS